jgi:hypothetical protein
MDLQDEEGGEIVDKLIEVKRILNHVRNDTEFQPHEFILDDLEVDWLIEEIERLRIVEQAYESWKKSIMMGPAPIAIPSFFTSDWYKSQKEQKRTEKDIADSLFISCGTLNKWKKKSGWEVGNGRKCAGRKRNPDVSIMKALRTKGLTYVQIGEAFSLTAQAVEYNIKKVGC